MKGVGVALRITYYVLRILGEGATYSTTPTGSAGAPPVCEHVRRPAQLAGPHSYGFLMSGRQSRYEAIAAFLRGVIDESQPGDRLPSDTELAGRFSVSRMTARQAVQVLEGEGLLVREQGRGTFVTSRQVARMLGSPLSFTTSMRAKGLTASSQIIELVADLSVWRLGTRLGRLVCSNRVSSSTRLAVA